MTWVCPKCERELKNEKQRHYCAKVSLHSLFEGKNEELILAFDKLLLQVADWEDIAISTTPNCVVFVHRITFLVIRPMKKFLDVKFYTAKPPKGLQLYKSEFYAGRYSNQVRLASVEDIEPQLISSIRNSYELL